MVVSLPDSVSVSSMSVSSFDLSASRMVAVASKSLKINTLNTQLSRFDRESHDLDVFLTVSRRNCGIARFLTI